MHLTEARYKIPMIVSTLGVADSDRNCYPCFVHPTSTDIPMFALVSDVVDSNLKWRDQMAGQRQEISLLKQLLLEQLTWRLLAEIEALRKTPEEERWPNSDWPNAQAFKDASAFVRTLPLTTIPLPDIGLADDGEVNFLWKSDGVHVDLGFYGTHTFDYFAQSKDGTKIYGDETPVSEGLPNRIISLFLL